MSVDYIVSSLPSLSFGAPAPISWERFVAVCGGEGMIRGALDRSAWSDLETQLRNAVAEARVGNDGFARPTNGCSLFWKNRVIAAFQEKDIAKRDELLDRIWWDAADELVPPASPLGAGALAAYAIRLKIAVKRAAISRDAGNAAFDRLTAETKLEFGK